MQQQPPLLSATAQQSYVTDPDQFVHLIMTYMFDTSVESMIQ